MSRKHSTVLEAAMSTPYMDEFELKSIQLQKNS